MELQQEETMVVSGLQTVDSSATGQEVKPYSAVIILPLGTGITEDGFKLHKQIEGGKRCNVTFIEKKTDTTITFTENERKDAFHFTVVHMTDKDKMNQGAILIQNLCRSICRKYKAFMEKEYATSLGVQSQLHTVVGEVTEMGCAEEQPQCLDCELAFVSEEEKLLHLQSVMHRYIMVCKEAEKPKPTLTSHIETRPPNSPPLSHSKLPSQKTTQSTSEPLDQPTPQAPDQPTSQAPPLSLSQPSVQSPPDPAPKSPSPPDQSPSEPPGQSPSLPSVQSTVGSAEPVKWIPLEDITSSHDSSEQADDLKKNEVFHEPEPKVMSLQQQSEGSVHSEPDLQDEGLLMESDCADAAIVDSAEHVNMLHEPKLKLESPNQPAESSLTLQEKSISLESKVPVVCDSAEQVNFMKRINKRFASEGSKPIKGEPTVGMETTESDVEAHHQIIEKVLDPNEDCIYFINSKCNHGESCKFRHCKAVRETTEVCQQWQAERTCNKADCQLRHQKQKLDESITGSRLGIVESSFLDEAFGSIRPAEPLPKKFKTKQVRFIYSSVYGTIPMTGDKVKFKLNPHHTTTSGAIYVTKADEDEDEEKFESRQAVKNDEALCTSIVGEMHRSETAKEFVKNLEDKIVSSIKKSKTTKEYESFIQEVANFTERVITHGLAQYYRCLHVKHLSAVRVSVVQASRIRPNTLSAMYGQKLNEKMEKKIVEELSDKINYGSIVEKNSSFVNTMEEKLKDLHQKYGSENQDKVQLEIKAETRVQVMLLQKIAAFYKVKFQKEPDGESRFICKLTWTSKSSLPITSFAAISKGREEKPRREWGEKTIEEFPLLHLMSRQPGGGLCKLCQMLVTKERARDHLLEREHCKLVVAKMKEHPTLSIALAEMKLPIDAIKLVMIKLKGTTTFLPPKFLNEFQFLTGLKDTNLDADIDRVLKRRKAVVAQKHTKKKKVPTATLR